MPKRFIRSFREKGKSASSFVSESDHGALPAKTASATGGASSVSRGKRRTWDMFTLSASAGASSASFKEFPPNGRGGGHDQALRTYRRGPVHTLLGIALVLRRLEDFTELFKIPDVPTSLYHPEPKKPRQRARKK